MTKVLNYNLLLEENYDSNKPQLDLMLRVRGMKDEAAIDIFETKTFVSPFMELFLENKILREVVRNQWRNYKYNVEYTRFLLGDYTQDEFVSVARDYASSFRHIDDNQQLAFACSILLRTLSETLSSGDLSSLLNVDPTEIETTLSSYHFAIKESES